MSVGFAPPPSAFVSLNRFTDFLLNRVSAISHRDILPPGNPRRGHRPHPVREPEHTTAPATLDRSECPVGRSFEDPSSLQGSEEERLAIFRRVRDEVRHHLRGLPSA